MANLTPRCCGLPEYVCLVYLQSVFLPRTGNFGQIKINSHLPLVNLQWNFMRLGENKSRLIWILIAFISYLFGDYNFCNVKLDNVINKPVP